MFKPRRFIASLALMAVLITGCTSGGGGTTSTQATPTPIPPPAVPEKPTYTVRRGEVIDSLSFTGRVSPVIEESLFFRTGGRVKRVYVERNDLVEAGTVLAELENDDLLRQLAQAQIELETAELNLGEAQTSQQFTVDKAAIDLDIMRLELAKLQQSLAGANLDVELAQAALDDLRAGASEVDTQIARSELERARNSLWSAQVSRDSTCGQTKGAACDSAQASVQSAEESVRIQELRLQDLLDGPDAAAIRGREADLEKALQNRGRLVLDIQIRQQNIRLKELEVAKLEAEIDPQLTKNVDRNKLAVERLEAQVGETQIVSPIKGKITSVSAYEGRNTEAYREVFVVSDEADLEVTAEPLSSQLQRLQEGMDATLVLSAYPGKELSAKIIQLPYPYGGGGGQSVEEADKMTHISFDPDDLVLNPGDLVRVNVVIERIGDALWLPPAAIRTFSGRTFVVVQEGDAQRRVDVTTGIQSTERVEITDGLEEGQIIVGQ
jgi:HlyD family secretion protein